MTLKRKIETGKIRNAQTLHRDFLLIFQNAMIPGCKYALSLLSYIVRKYFNYNQYFDFIKFCPNGSLFLKGGKIVGDPILLHMKFVYLLKKGRQCKYSTIV